MMNFMFLSPNVDNLVDYFKKSFGGALDIDYKYESLEMNIEQLMNNNIRVDKLIIVFYSDGGFNIKNEMSCLGKLIEGNSFFKVNEILLFSEDTEYCNNGISAFKFIMKNINYTNYSVKVYEEGISITNIYRDVMGIVPDDFTRTSYNIVYRVEKGSESKVGYTPRERKKPLEPSIRNGNEEYNKFKENSVRTETGKLIVDIHPKEIDNIDINLDVFKSNLHSIKNAIIFAGLPKSGTSALACSTLFQTDNCILIDLSRNNGSCRMLKKLTVGNGTKYPSIDFVDNRDLLLSKSYNDNSLKCINNEHSDLKIDFLKYILSIPNRLSYDKLLIDCDLDSLDDVVKLLDEKVRKIIFTCESVREEFDLIKPSINSLDKFEKYVFLNEYLSLREGYSPLSPLVANTELENCKVIKGEKLFKDNISLEVFI